MTTEEILLGSKIIETKRDKEGRLLKLIIVRTDGKKQKLTPHHSHMGYYYLIENDIPE